MNGPPLQRCEACGRRQYPARELCGNCLADALSLEPVAGATGTVLAATTLHHSLDPALAGELPLVLVSIELDDGPVVLAHAENALAAGLSVRISTASGARKALLYAQALEEHPS